jgi:ATP-dependent DNA helicase PIF1
MLGWALSVHKCVGMTLASILVHCDGMWADGQFYTAVSRCRTLAGVYLKGFDEGAIRANPDVVSW